MDGYIKIYLSFSPEQKFLPLPISTLSNQAGKFHFAWVKCLVILAISMAIDSISQKSAQFNQGG